MTEFRTERDSMGAIQVPQDALWGPQTQRAIKHFGTHTQMPKELVHAIARIKAAAAQANLALHKIEKNQSQAIVHAASLAASGDFDKHFPLSIFISGSGTQSNMNVNEVIAALAAQFGKVHIHPNDHVNCSQSTNCVFPSAIHVASVIELESSLLPTLRRATELLISQAKEWETVYKCARTHLMDAVPITFGQEVGGWAATFADADESICNAVSELLAIPVGGTAVGTGLNAPKGFDEKVCEFLNGETGLNFRPSRNKFAAQSGHEAMLQTMSALKRLAVALLRIANDIRMSGSGPRCGLSELVLPANEPGSSIMPGKVNPTQCEAIAMRAAQVIGYEVAVTIGCGGGFQQMNVYKPLIGNNILDSIRLLDDGLKLFIEHCLVGLCPDRKQMKSHLEHSLMLVTALNPKIGYEKAADIAKLAHQDGLTLRQATLQLGYLSGEEFDHSMDYTEMAFPHGRLT